MLPSNGISPRPVQAVEHHFDHHFTDLAVVFFLEKEQVARLSSNEASKSDKIPENLARVQSSEIAGAELVGTLVRGDVFGTLQESSPSMDLVQGMRHLQFFSFPQNSSIIWWHASCRIVAM